MGASRINRVCGVCLVALLTVRSLGAAPGGTAVVEAVKGGDVARLRALIHQHEDVNQADPDGTTALHWAIYRDDGAAAAALLQAGARATAVNRYGVTPLTLACLNGNAALISQLLDAGADPNTGLASGETPLMTAARAGKVEAMVRLLARGAQVNATEPWKGQTALMWAAATDNAAAVEALAAAGADLEGQSKNGFTSLLFGVRQGALDSVRTLLNLGANANDTLPNGMGALLLAVINAHYDVAALLLDYGADASADVTGWTALHQIVMTRRSLNTYPLPVATGSFDSLKLVPKLVAYGANPNARLVKAPSDGYANKLNRKGATAFLLAAQGVDVSLMRALQEAGADPRLANDEGTTPLMTAAGIGLFSVGQSPGSPDEVTEAVKLCLALGGDPAVVDANGDTALHGAALRGANDAVQLLVAAGGKLDVKNKAGYTPWRMADGVFIAPTFKQQPETAKLLRQLMEERGVWVEPPPREPDGGAGAAQKPRRPQG
jgi:ankyrin repeat protein